MSNQNLLLQQALQVQQLGYQICSARLESQAELNSKGEIKKKVKLITDGNKNPRFEPNDYWNSYFIMSGKSAKVSILDLDNMDATICKELYDSCFGRFPMVKTRKGYHIFGLYTKDLIDGRYEEYDIFNGTQGVIGAYNTYNYMEQTFMYEPVGKEFCFPTETFSEYHIAIINEFQAFKFGALSTAE